MIDLYPRQQKALAKLRSGSILCGGVGSGKSRTALAYYFLNEKGKDLYIITTAKKRDSLEWEEEFTRAGVLYSCDVSGGPLFVDGSSVYIDSWNNIQKYKDICDCFFIFDEQRVVGSGAWSKTFIKIARRNSWLLLTATPGDNWSDYIPVFVANGFYKNRSEFLARHAVFARYAKYPKIDRWVDTKRLVALRRRILVTMEYTKPAEHKVRVINCNYSVKAYKDILRDRFDYEKNEPISSQGRFCYLLRICGNNLDKLAKVSNILKEYGPAIIFYNYDQEYYDLCSSLSAQGYTVRCYNGHQHDPTPSGEFSPNSKWAYLVQYNAGAEGWNCIATPNMIFYSLNYSYKMMLQASGRIDRCNTPFRELNYFVLTNDSPIEYRIRDCLKRKEKFNENAYKEELYEEI